MKKITTGPSGYNTKQTNWHSYQTCSIAKPMENDSLCLVGNHKRIDRRVVENFVVSSIPNHPTLCMNNRLLNVGKVRVKSRIDSAAVKLV